jgi:hypothetical protein
VVGVRFLNDGTTRAVLCARGAEPEEPVLPEGYVTAEASSINNEGAVVGTVDGPNGSKIGPNGFIYEKGRLRLIREAGDALTAATAINDRRQVAGVFEKEDEPELKKPSVAKPGRTDTPR